MELLSALPARLSRWIAALVGCLDLRVGPRLALLLFGLFFARGRRTATSWFRPAGIRDDFRPAYCAIASAGKHTDAMAAALLRSLLRPLLEPCARLVFGLDDTPTRRYGPCVEGAGIHHNPTPGPTNAPFVYGHIWVTLVWLAQHPAWDTLALPLLARLYIRHKDIAKLPQHYRWPFATKLTLAVQLLDWLLPQLQPLGKPVWAVVDGGYAKRPFLRPARAAGVTVVGRLRKDAALCTLPPGERPPGKRGPMPTYGKKRISLAKRAGQTRGWHWVQCQQYGQTQRKLIKTFLATWRPAGGIIRVVIVKEDTGWLAFFRTQPKAEPTEVEASAEAADVLSLAADRGAAEQMFKDVKEVWGAGQQQLRNLHANVGAYHLNLWAQTLVEGWAWEQEEQRLVDREDAPWDQEPRRPSQADKRRALQQEILGDEIQDVLSRGADPEEFQALSQRLLRLLR